MSASSIRNVASLILAALTFAATGCRTVGSSDDSQVASLVDAYNMRKSAIDSNYWIVDCENGIQETRHKDEIVAQKFCETVPVYQYFAPSRQEAKYSIVGNETSPNYGLRGVRFNLLKYPMKNEAGQPLTQPLSQCYDIQNKDWFVSTGNCDAPHESGQRKGLLGYVLKSAQAPGATMNLLRCVRAATPSLEKDTRYSTDGVSCQTNFDVVGGVMGVVLKKFPSQTGGND